MFKAILLPTALVISTVSGCFSSTPSKGVTLKDLDVNPNVTSKREILEVSCGTQTAQLEYRFTGPRASDPAEALKLFKSPTRFALVLNGSSGTTYFSDMGGEGAKYHRNGDPNAKTSPYKDLVDNLAGQGYRVMELRYTNAATQCGSAGWVTGFHSACCGQGLDNVKEHHEKLYDAAIQELGFHADNAEHKLVGLGWSHGATQIQSMAFQSGRKFDKIALSGVIMGDSYEGCSRGQLADADFDGLSWKSFMKHADAITKSTEGCSNPDKMEYSNDHHFANAPFRDHWDLALFEGTDVQPDRTFNATSENWALAGALPHQASVLEQSRTAVTSKTLYPNCGHEVLFCTRGKAANDMLEYLTR